MIVPWALRVGVWGPQSPTEAGTCLCVRAYNIQPQGLPPCLLWCRRLSLPPPSPAPAAQVNSCVREVITNLSAFQRVEEPAAAAARPHASWLHRAFGGGGGGAADAAKPASQRLVVTPRHPYHECCHGCPLCPENLCKVGCRWCDFWGAAWGGTWGQGCG